MKKHMRPLLLYIGRWELSTFTLAPVLILLSNVPTLVATVIANLIGALIFYNVDRLLFKRKVSTPLWEIRENYSCASCGEKGLTFRIVEWGSYNRIDSFPQWRCWQCAKEKREEVRRKI